MVRNHDRYRSPRALARRRSGLGRLLRALPIALLASVALLLAASAQARVETVRWRQSDMTDVAGWKIYAGLASGSYGPAIVVTSAVPDGDGVFHFDIEVDDTASIYVAMRSFATDGRESPLSNEKIKVGSTTPPPPPPGGGSSTYRLNAGGPSTLSVGGSIWSADDPHVDGGTSSNSVRTIAGTSMQALYHSKRWGGSEGDPLTWSLPVSAGLHRVRLHFVETYEPNFSPGKRLFHVRIEGEQVLTNYDIFATVGANTAAVEEFEVNVSDGAVTIDLVRVGSQTPTIAAIEVESSTALVPPKAPILIPSN